MGITVTVHYIVASFKTPVHLQLTSNKEATWHASPALSSLPLSIM
jgi:hypothetical protein